MLHIERLDEIGAEFAKLDMQPLTIRAIMKRGAGMVAYDSYPIQLDGLLAKAVIMTALWQMTLPDALEAYWLPLPLKMLWQAEDGLPLWAASCFYPVKEYATGTIILHKRNARLNFSDNANIKTNKGRYMERQLPVPVVYAEEWQARCIGNKAMLEHLLTLDNFPAIGKHRSRINGQVKRWVIEEANWSDGDIYTHEGRLIKALPVEAQLIQWPEAPVRVGWTPPAWKPSLHTMGFRPGTYLSIDYFNAV